MRKWNYNKQEYEPYSTPIDWYCPLTEEMDEVVNCPSCGRKITFGEGYSSRVIHTDRGGMGYTICYSCHINEIEEENRYKEKIK